MLYQKGPNDDLVSAEDALCAQVDPELFFTTDTGGGAREGSVGAYMAAKYAKTLCAKCPLTFACLMTAVANEEKYGIWGGAVPKERKSITTKAHVLKFVEELKASHEE